MTETTSSLETFPSLLGRLWTWVRVALLVAAGAGALLVLVTIALVHVLVRMIDPALAWAVTGFAVVLVAAVAGPLAWRWLRTPRALVPPDLPVAEETWTADHRDAFQAYAVAFLRRQARNPHLPDDARAKVPLAIASIETTHAAARRGDSPEAARTLVATVTHELDGVLAPLDARARALIRRTAVEVSVASAVSPSALLDALIVGQRNLSMISSLADLYYGRPGPRATFRVMGDVVGSAAAAGVLDTISDNLTHVLTDAAGAWGARLGGPLGQGVVNGLLTLRIGAAARARCRSIRAARIPWRSWSLGEYRRVVGTLVRWTTDVAASRFGTPVIERTRGAAGWLSRLFGGGPQRAEIPAPARAPASAAEDPLLSSDLLED